MHEEGPRRLTPVAGSSTSAELHPEPAPLWRWLPLLAVVAVAVGWRGAYGQDARAVVATLTGLAAVGAVAWAPAATSRAVRSPVVLVLAGLALLSALSAVWTTGAPSIAVRDGLAVLALAAAVAIASTLRPTWAHAGVLLAVAVAVALAGMVAAVARSQPLALSICGTWRPAGPFEYPPALGLVCAGALPPALALGAGVRRSRAIPGAALAWLLAFSVAVTSNRTAIGLAGLAVVAAVWLAPRRLEVGPLAVAVIASAAGSALIVGSHLGDAGAGRLLLAAALVLVPCAAVGVTGRSAARRRWIAVVAIAALGATAASVVADRGSGCQGDASHGRIGIWRAAVNTARDRPLQGFGSGTFLAASRAQQLKERPRPTRFAHDLPLELWVELGVAGLALALAWYAVVARAALSALRANPEAWLLAPMAIAFPLANLLDWPWHLLGAGMVWAVAMGGLLRTDQPAQSPTPTS